MFHQLETIASTPVAEMSFMADSAAAEQVQDCLKTVYTLVHEIEKKRQVSEQGMNAIAKIQDGEKGRSYSVSMLHHHWSDSCSGWPCCNISAVGDESAVQDSNSAGRARGRSATQGAAEDR